MTLVVGTVLHDGAILASDCRVTWRTGAGAPIQTDVAQKLFRLGTNHAIAAAGGVETLQLMIPHLLAAFRTRRTDAVSVRRWLPGWMREFFRAAARQYSIRELDVMVASSIRMRRTRLPRESVLRKLTETAEAGNRVGALRCLQILASQREPIVEVPESSIGVLYRMVAPAFRPRDCKPFEILSGGSGHGVSKFLKPHIPQFAFAESTVAASWIFEAVGDYLVGQDDGGAGGAVLVAHTCNGRVESIVNSKPVKEGEGFTVRLQADRYVVRNEKTREEVKLRLPLELLTSPPTRPKVFDPLREMFRDAAPTGGTVKGPSSG